MLENWVSPVKSKQIFENLEQEAIGNKITVYQKKFPSLKQTKVALVGVGAVNVNAIRSQLYQLDDPFSLSIADIGNTRKKETEFLIPLLKEILDSGIFPILIGEEAVLTQAQYKAFLSLQKAISLAVIDERIPFHPANNHSSYYLNDIVQNDGSQLFHLGMIGVQAHFGPHQSYRLAEEKNFDIARLGNARANISELEPVIRDADLLSFHLAAIRQIEAPGQKKGSPGGFILEEACQIARYAGMSDKLKSFGIFGFSKKYDRDNQTSQLVAQMIWYFLEGFANRKKDYPASNTGLVEYIVELKKLNYQLTFWKSKQSGRWWMQIPVRTKKNIERHRLVPCSYNDYKKACQEELPDRLLNALKRFI